MLGDTHIRLRGLQLRDELFNTAGRERAVRVGRVGVIQLPQACIIGAVDGPAVGRDERVQLVAGQHQL